MTKEEAKFERFMSRSVLLEIAKMLGIADAKILKKPPTGQVTRPSIARYYGEQLIIPQSGEWSMTITITLWLGKFNIDIARRKSVGGVYDGTTLELSYDAANPEFMNDVVRHYHEMQKIGPP